MSDVYVSRDTGGFPASLLGATVTVTDTEPVQSVPDEDEPDES